MNYEEVIKENSRLIWKLASSFYGTPKEDLYQAGVVGLIKAMKHYNEKSDAKFSTYAHNYIFGEMYLLANNKDIKVNKDTLKLYKKIETLRYTLAQKLGYIPTNYELSEYMEIDLEQIDFAVASAKSILSLDNDANNDDRKIIDIVSTSDKDIFDKVVVSDCLDILNSEEKKIIESRYFEDLTQSEVANKLGITQVKVSRYEKRSLNKMGEYLNS